MNTLEKLAKSAVEGSKESWRMLIEQFAMPWARNAAFHWLRRSNCRMPIADFADITHDAVLKLLEHGPRLFDGPIWQAPLRLRNFINCDVSDAMRKYFRTTNPLRDEEAEETEGVDLVHGEETRDMLDYLDHILSRTDFTREEKCVIDAQLAGHSLRETASLLGTTLDKVRYRYNHALRKLRKAWLTSLSLEAA